MRRTLVTALREGSCRDGEGNGRYAGVGSEKRAEIVSRRQFLGREESWLRNPTLPNLTVAHA